MEHERAPRSYGCLGSIAACVDPDVLAAYVDGRLGPDHVARVDRHIDACRACRAELSALAAVHTRTVQRPRPLSPPAPAARDLPETLGRYRIVRELGRGAMGVVLHAHDPQLGRDVAIKRLHHTDAGTRARLLGEAQAMARLRHPNVVAIYDVVAEGDAMFVAMELVAGDTLATLVAPWPERLAACIAAGRGLAAAHAAHLVHRDVKPANILVAGSDVRITDFGLACTDDGHLEGFAGTPTYMAPELFVGGPATAQSDQFSLCVTIYEVVYGRRPFPATSVDELCARIEDGPRLPRETVVPAWIGAAIARGLSPDPAARFPTTGDLLAALASPPSRLGRWCAAGGLALAAASALALHMSTKAR